MSFRALRPALRAARAPRVPAARSGPVRFASSAPQQAADAAKDAAGKAQHAAEKVKHAAKGSDAPWAIGSLLVFLREWAAAVEAWHRQLRGAQQQMGQRQRSAGCQTADAASRAHTLVCLAAP
jgi:deferrochelatase/peroxidase EfeB